MLSILNHKLNHIICSVCEKTKRIHFKSLGKLILMQASRKATIGDWWPKNIPIVGSPLDKMLNTFVAFWLKKAAKTNGFIWAIRHSLDATFYENRQWGTFSPLKGAAHNRFSAEEAKHGKFGTLFSSKTFEHKYTNHTSFASKHLYRV